MIKLRDIIMESTFSMNADVDYIYRVGKFKDFMRAYKSGKQPFSMAVGYRHMGGYDSDVTLATLSSAELPSATAKRCNSLNPVTIRCGIFHHGSYYLVNDGIIQMSMNHNALQTIYQGSFTMSKLDSVSMHNEISETRIKGTINHELAHWADDTLRNRHLQKMFKTAAELHAPVSSILHTDINLSYVEIEAQIAAIKQLYRKNKSTWDKLTLAQLFVKIPSLRFIAQTYGRDSKATLEWQRKLMTRMSREGLLGKSMRNFVYGHD